MRNGRDEAVSAGSQTRLDRVVNHADTNYYTQKPDLHDELLQGDGWTGLVAINFKTKESKAISGVIISNSCDVSADNDRALPVNVLFAPIIRLTRYEKLLRKGLESHRAENVVGDIRRQRVTSLIYLPVFSDVIKESIVPWTTSILIRSTTSFSKSGPRSSRSANMDSTSFS